MLDFSSYQSLIIETVPFPFHRKKGFCLENWSNKRIHLTHVTAEPEQPAAGPCQHQDNLMTSKTLVKMKHAFAILYLDDALVRASGHHEGEDDAHHAPDGGEDDAGEEGGPHACLCLVLALKHTPNK